MVVIIVLVGSLLVFRGLGAAGAALFASWVAAARYALAVMLCFTAIGHFTRLKDDMARMIPEWVPRPLEMVYFTGLCEFAGAAGLCVPSLRRVAGAALVAFFVAVLPANIHAARAGVTLGGRAVTGLWIRIPMQIVFIALAWWTSR
jgi:uncharacterized membrane protein